MKGRKQSARGAKKHIYDVDEAKREARVWDRERRTPKFASPRRSVVRCDDLTLVTRRDRLFELAKLRWLQQRAGGLVLPRDVCRLIARFVTDSVVVVHGGSTSVHPNWNEPGHEPSPDPEEDEAYVCDLASTGNQGWQPTLLERVVGVRRETQKLMPPRVVAEAVVESKQEDQPVWSFDGHAWYLGLFRSQPSACDPCKENRFASEEGRHCCCCCTRFFRVTVDGTVTQLPPLHLFAEEEDSTRLDDVVLCDTAMVVFQGRLWVLGGEQLASHFFLHGCPTCNAPTSSTFSLDLAAPDAWQRGPRMPARRMCHTAAVVGDAIVVAGGGDGDAFKGYRTVNSVYLLSSATAQEWVVGPHLPRSLCRLSITSV